LAARCAVERLSLGRANTMPRYSGTHFTLQARQAEANESMSWVSRLGQLLNLPPATTLTCLACFPVPAAVPGLASHRSSGPSWPSKTHNKNQRGKGAAGSFPGGPEPPHSLPCPPNYAWEVGAGQWDGMQRFIVWQPTIVSPQRLLRLPVVFFVHKRKDGGLNPALRIHASPQ
jgi:hypothetical protein